MKKNRTKAKANIGMIVSTHSLNQWTEGAHHHRHESRSIAESNGDYTYVDSHDIILTAGRFDIPPHDLEGK